MNDDEAKTALLVVDVQNDFCRGGALAVPGAEGIVDGISELMAEREIVVLTQDWHPPGHSSFISARGPQSKWPDHCVQGTHGAEFHPRLDAARARMVLRKGMDPETDCYSAFFENDRATPTGLDGFLRGLGARSVEIVGLATDFCVKWTAIDAELLGYEPVVRLDLCRGVDADGSLDAALKEMKRAGVRLCRLAP